MIICQFFHHGTDDLIATHRMWAVPRADEFVMLSVTDQKPMRVTMVIYDLHLSVAGETKVRVLLERMI